MVVRYFIILFRKMFVFISFYTRISNNTFSFSRPNNDSKYYVNRSFNEGSEFPTEGATKQTS